MARANALLMNGRSGFSISAAMVGSGTPVVRNLYEKIIKIMAVEFPKIDITLHVVERNSARLPLSMRF